MKGRSREEGGTKGSDVYTQLRKHRALWCEHAGCMCISHQRWLQVKCTHNTVDLQTRLMPTMQYHKLGICQATICILTSLTPSNNFWFQTTPFCKTSLFFALCIVSCTCLPSQADLKIIALSLPLHLPYLVKDSTVKIVAVAKFPRIYVQL